MKKAFLVCICFFNLSLITSSLAQQTFYKEFHGSSFINSLYAANSIAVNDSTYWVIINYDDGACSDGYYILVLNKNGNVISSISNNLGGDQGGYMESTPYKENYVIGGSTYCGDSAIVFLNKVRSSPQGVEWSARISELEYSTYVNTMFCSDSSIIARYYFSIDGKQHFRKYSKSGSILFNKTYTFGDGTTKMVNGFNESFYMPLNKSDSVIGKYVQILKLNKNADSLTTFNLEKDSIYYVYGMSKLMNGNFLTYGLKPNPLSASNPIKFLAEVDTNGTFIWTKYNYWHSNNTLLTYCQSLDSSLALVFRENYNKCYILKCTSTGDSLIKKNYQINPSFTFKSIHATPDTGFILAGEAYSYDYGFVLKTDGNGDTGVVATKINHVENFAESFEIFPNPAKSITQIKYQVSETNIEIRIENYVGQIIYNSKLDPQNDEILIDVDQFYSGIYFCSLWSAGNKIQTKKMVIVK